MFTKLQSNSNCQQLHEEKSALSSPNHNRLYSMFKKRCPKLSQIPYSFGNLDSPISTDKEICDLFNDFFSSVFNNACYVEPYCPLQSAASMNTVAFSLSSISKQISKLPLSYVPGPDGVSPAMIKLGGPDIPLLLLTLFNTSIQTPTVPVKWKHSYIFPCHKRGSRSTVSNYRPINHTPILSRIMERIIKQQLFQFINSENLLNFSQYGFIEGRSCSSCQYDFFNKLTASIDENEAIVIPYLDLHKAFDTVPHTLLMTKLASFGIKDPLLSWFSSYFTNRSQSVRVRNSVSASCPITSGVIQGSVLGPLLFLIFINDIFETISYGKPYIFADDIKVVYSFDPSQLNSIVSIIQSDLHRLDLWCSKWFMQFSPSKCQTLSNKCRLPSNLLTLHASFIPNVNCVRDLGLHYSCTFNFSEHIALQVAKARRLSFLILRNFQLKDSRLILFKSHVRPLLEYCSHLYSNLRKCDSIAIEHVQRKFTKPISRTDLSYRQRCHDLNLQPLWLRRVILNLLFLFRLIHKLIYSNSDPVSFAEKKSYNLRRNIFLLPVYKSRSSTRSNFFINKYSSLWNTLPDFIRSATSIQSFRILLYI